MTARVLLAAAVATLAFAALLPGSAGGAETAASGDNWELFQEEGLEDFDARAGRIGPTRAQLATVRDLGAHVSWNRFGTPQSLISFNGYLATGLSTDAVRAARSFLSRYRGLFKLGDRALSNLELVNDSKLPQTRNAHVVLFRQRFGEFPAALDGMITVGVDSGKIAYVSSSSVGDLALSGSVALSPVEAWIKAAGDVGRAVAAADVSSPVSHQGWNVFAAPGFAQQQRSRLVAFPTISNGVRVAYETIVLDVKGGHSAAYTHFIDAQTGKVWYRQNQVEHFAMPAPRTSPFSGSYTPTECGPFHGPYTATADDKTIDVVASADAVTDDIILELHHPQGTVVASSDVLFSPELIHYTGTGGVIPPGEYFVRVCPFDPSHPEEQTPPHVYAGNITINDVAGSSFPYPPKWKYFEANPEMLNGTPPVDANLPDTDTRIRACWESRVGNPPIDVPDCDTQLRNLASRAPWDVDIRAGAPTFTSKGNNANTSEAWGSPLTPFEQYRPVKPDREYFFPWTDQWNNTKCSPTAFFTPTRNDIDSAIISLFSNHNRMHDWSYRLGFTEQNYNAQEHNFGNTAPGPFPLGRENDPEYGNAQAGALTGGQPSFLGRDNANQITLNDGVPPITNMYLWQPLAAGFYPPCVDGDYDMSVIGHEYTHLISNRMVGGPDANLTGLQAGAMGESWSDLTAVEYVNEYGYVPTNDESPFAVGAYVTGEKQRGIRNYNMSDSPLNYSDVGYDLTGPQVHADGEIWSATNFDIRQLLIQKYNALGYKAGDEELQRRCADAETGLDRCPGNRRWIQIVFDAWLLMQPAVSMVDARDAYLAADLLRTGGKNHKELWLGFARRGLGQHAVSDTNLDTDPTPSFESPKHPEGTVSFAVRATDEGGKAVKGDIYVGTYTGRATPVADTDPATGLGRSVRLVAGTYEFRVRANGYGINPIQGVAVVAGTSQNLVVGVRTNWASTHKGAVAAGDGVNLQMLIDDDEATNWASLGAAVQGKRVIVDLSGSAPVKVQHLHVSAMLRPADATAFPADPGSQNRFSALRSFKIYTCNEATADCSQESSFVLRYTSPADFFPADRPRPTAPDLVLSKPVELSSSVSATHVKLEVVDNQCTGGPDFEGELDNDPINVTDCSAGSAQDNNVRAAELQVFTDGHDASTGQTG